MQARGDKIICAAGSLVHKVAAVQGTACPGKQKLLEGGDTALFCGFRIKQRIGCCVCDPRPKGKQKLLNMLQRISGWW